MGKDQDLLEACRTGNISAIEKLLAGRLGNKAKGSKGAGGGALSSLSKSFMSLKSANVNCVDGSGDTPLHLAALNGHKEIVTILLECEASPAQLDSRDCSPLHLAAWSGHTDICNELLEAPEGQSLINLQTRDGNTALHFAAQHGHDPTLSLLLQKRGDPTIRNLEDLSPLDLAAQYDRLELVKLLVGSHPALLAQRSAHQTPLHLASRNGHRAVVQYLLQQGFPTSARTDKGSALHEAANFCKLEVIKLLLEKGVDITIKSETGCTAEDILRSIPSKAAEDALTILKTHIYHQRTPDSDGEKSLVDEVEDVPPPPIRTSASVSQPSPSVPVDSGPKPVADKRNHLLMSLTTSTDSPPPLPPRQSLAPTYSVPPPQSLPPLQVPDQAPAPDNEEDKSSLSANPSPSPRDSSPSSGRSQLERPKKPPRKKPNSFRKNDLSAVPTSSEEGQGTPVARSNYHNLDPLLARMEMDKAADDTYSLATPISSGDSKRGENGALPPDTVPVTACDKVEDPTSRVASNPPQSLDIDPTPNGSPQVAPTAPSKIRQPQPPTVLPPPPALPYRTSTERSSPWKNASPKTSRR